MSNREAITESDARFLNTMFKAKPSNQWTLIWTLPDKRSSWFKNPDEASAYALAQQDKDVYFGVGSSPQNLGEKKRCRANLIAGIPGLWLDIDVASPEHKKKNILATKDEAMSLLEKIPLKPSIIVNSGHGLHVYWLFDSFWSFANEEERQNAAQLAHSFNESFRRLSREAGFDADSTHDLARVMRVPGTLNLKSAPTAVSIVEWVPELYYEPEQLHSCLSSSRVSARKNEIDVDLAMENDKGSLVLDPQALLPEDKWKQLQVSNPLVISTFCHMRKDLQDQSPSAYDMSLAIMATAAGWSDQEIINLLIAHRRHNKADLKLRKNYYLLTLQNARQYISDQHINCKSFQPAQCRRLTDLGNAERLVDSHGQDLRFCDQKNEWLVWTGQRWSKDDTREVERKAKDTVRSIYNEAAETLDQHQRQEISRHALKSESEAKIRAMISLARSESRIVIRPSELDMDPWLFNCENGTLDLRTGRLRELKREDLITKLAAVHYDESANAPIWLEFIQQVTGDNQELIDYLQRVIGYCLTGITSERSVFILYGSGRNGKSTFLAIIRNLFGGYAKTIRTETLMVKKNDTIPTDLADIMGARFVSAVEPEDGHRLAESQIKILAGGTDSIKVRHLYQNEFEYVPTYKLFIASNHKPIIRGTDNAIWDRIKLIHFGVRIPEENLDKEMASKLLDELPGILAWAVEGCIKWRHSGLGDPQCIRAATQEYRYEMDSVRGFVSARCEVGASFSLGASELYQNYLDWCKESGNTQLTQKAFGHSLAEQGFKSRRGTAGKHKWLGLKLR